MLRINVITRSTKTKYRKDLEAIVEILKLHEKIEIRNYAKNGDNK